MAAPPLSISQLPVFSREQLPIAGTDLSFGAVFLMDKPSGWSSFDVVKFLRNRIRTRKTGHAGTLDPLATGLLVLCAGKATKSISEIQEYPKRYRAIVEFGTSTPSQDAATEPDAHSPFDHISRDAVEQLVSEKFTGTILQVPPMYSALWKDGKRLYTYARKGEEVEREPREAVIHELKICDFGDGKMEIDVLCGKGTYIRTLAHDLGLELGSRAHLSGLRRTEIGHFHVDQALTVEQIRELYADGA